MAGLLDAYQAAQTTPTPVQMSLFQRNAPYIAPGASNFNTQLPMLQEMQFRDWVSKNRVPFDANAGVQDYDMRGFWQALMNGNPRATTAANANDGQMHYPDYWKTPFHESFSNESQWAGPMAPRWNDKDQLFAPNGKILFDERAKNK